MTRVYWRLPSYLKHRSRPSVQVDNFTINQIDNFTINQLIVKLSFHNTVQVELSNVCTIGRLFQKKLFVYFKKKLLHKCLLLFEIDRFNVLNIQSRLLWPIFANNLNYEGFRRDEVWLFHIHLC